MKAVLEDEWKSSTLVTFERGFQNVKQLVDALIAKDEVNSIFKLNANNACRVFQNI